MPVDFYQEEFTIAATHPALPGHFPGRPIVPGVVVLDRVATALKTWRGQDIAAMPQVKFLAPLLPEVGARIELEGAGVRIRFRVLRDTTLLASGDIEPA